MSITITGHLERDAWKGSTLSGEALLMLHVRAGRGWPFEVAHSFGSSAAGHISAEDMARELRTGAPCTATFDLLRPRNDHDRAVMVAGQIKELAVAGRVLAA